MKYFDEKSIVKCWLRSLFLSEQNSDFEKLSVFVSSFLREVTWYLFP